MKTKELLLINTGFCLIAASGQSAELPTATRLENAPFYAANFCRYKPGMTEEARGYIENYFQPAQEQIGRNIIAFHTQTGPWHHTVYFPLSEGPAELAWQTSPADERWWRAFAELAGGADEAREIWSQYQNTVERCETELVYRHTDIGDMTSSLEGTWRMSDNAIVGGPNAGQNSNPQPSLLMINDGHYSQMFVTGDEPRELFDDESPSAETIAEITNAFVANAGTYERNGSTITLRPTVAKSPNVMGIESIEHEYELEGDTLVLILRPEDWADLSVSPPAGGDFGEIRQTFVRVE